MMRLSLIVKTALVLSMLIPAAATVAAQEIDADAGRAVVESMVETVLNGGDFDVADTVFAPEFVSHGYGTADLTRDEYLAAVASLRVAMPDFNADLEVLIADDIWAASRLRFSGTFTEPWQFNSDTVYEPTGEPIEWTQNTLHRIEDGLIVADFAAFDRLGLLIQMGASPVPPLIAALLQTGTAEPIEMTEAVTAGMEQAHGEAFTHVIEDALNDGDLDAIDLYMAEDYSAYEPFGNFSREQFKSIVGALRAVVPDLHTDIDVMVTEGDWLAARLIYTGTFANPIEVGPLSVPATGEPIRLIINVFVHFGDEGIGFEDFKEYNRLGWLIQAGLLEG